MNTTQINDMVYATNPDLTGFFSRRESGSAYNQLRGNGQIFFASEKEFRKFARAFHQGTVYDYENCEAKYADVTSGGKFVWRLDK